MHYYDALQWRISADFLQQICYKEVVGNSVHRRSKVNTMKIVHLIALLLVVVGGFHAVLATVGIDVFGTVFGAGVHMTLINLVIGLATVYYVFPMLKSHLNAH